MAVSRVLSGGRALAWKQKYPQQGERHFNWLPDLGKTPAAPVQTCLAQRGSDLDPELELPDPPEGQSREGCPFTECEHREASSRDEADPLARGSMDPPACGERGQTRGRPSSPLRCEGERRPRRASQGGTNLETVL